MTKVKQIIIELYDKKHKRVKVEGFTNEQLIFALALGKNWELLDEGNYWLSIM